jgi:hypothetical protein
LKVDYTLENIAPHAVWENVIVAESQWAIPKKGSFKDNLGKLYNDYGTYKSSAKKLQTYLKGEFSVENQYKRFIDALALPEQSEEVQIFT